MLNYAAKVISILLAEKYEYSIQSSVVRSKVVSLQNRHEQTTSDQIFESNFIWFEEGSGVGAPVSPWVTPPPPPPLYMRMYMYIQDRESYNTVLYDSLMHDRKIKT